MALGLNVTCSDGCQPSLLNSRNSQRLPDPNSYVGSVGHVLKGVVSLLSKLYLSWLHLSRLTTGWSYRTLHLLKLIIAF